MFYYIYKITNIHTQKIYIGSHQTPNLEDGYFGSGIYLKSAIAKHGKDSFSKEILEFCSNAEEMHKRETEILLQLQSENTYNLKFCALGGNTRANYTEEQKKAYIKKLIDNPNCPIGKAPNKGKKHSDATKEKMKAIKKEYYENITPEHFERWKTNVVRSAITRCAGMSEINCKPVRVECIKTGDVIIYKSKEDCAAFFNVSSATLTRYIDGTFKSMTHNIKLLLPYVITYVPKIKSTLH